MVSLYKNMHVGVTFSDVSQAFGCVNHEILLAKLHLYDTEG